MSKRVNWARIALFEFNSTRFVFNPKYVEYKKEIPQYKLRALLASVWDAIFETLRECNTLIALKNNIWMEIEYSPMIGT